MTRVVIRSKVGADGVLHLDVPVGPTDANQEVQVTIEAVRTGVPRPMTQEEWKAFILSTAGSITDPTFRRHEQGEYEPREELP